MAISDEDVNRIAEAIVEKAAEDVGVRDIMIGSVMGKGAIPLYGRETRQEPCACCLIDPPGPNAPENRMCTTKGAIGTLNDREEREWCSEINIVPDGRCARARAIGEAARECKEKYPEDTTKFFECYAPAFSQITKGNNPTIDLRGDYDEIAHVKDGILYRKGNIVQVWWDKWGKETWTDPSEEQARENFNAMKERWSPTETIDLTKGRMVEIRLDPTGRAIPPEESNPGEKVTVKCSICGEEIEIAEYDSLTRSEALIKHLEEKHRMRGNPGEYVTISGPGKTTFKVGEIISREAFEKENERVRKLGKKPATETEALVLSRGRMLQIPLNEHG